MAREKIVMEHGFTESALCEWWRSVRGTIAVDCAVRDYPRLPCKCRVEIQAMEAMTKPSKVPAETDMQDILGTVPAMVRAIQDVIALRDELNGDESTVSAVSRAFAAEIDRALKGQRGTEH